MLLEKYMHVFFACPVRSNPALCVEYASNRLYYLCTHDPPPFPAAAFSRDVRSRLPLMVLSRSLFRSTLLHPYRFWHSTTKHLLLENRTRSMINPILFHQSDSFMHICCQPRNFVGPNSEDSFFVKRSSHLQFYLICNPVFNF